MILLALAALVAVVGCSPSRNGGAGGGAPARAKAAPSGARLRVVLVPKVRGIDYFNAVEKGAREAANELDLELQFDGPTEDNPERQAEIVETWIARRANVIGVACNDPSAIAPVLKKARMAGIHVITFDADSTKEAREFFVNQAPADAIGTTLVDVMAKEAGEDAKTAIITSTLEAPNQNTWIKHMRERIKTKYPKMSIVTVEPSQENQQKAAAATQSVLKSHPEVTGFFAITSEAFPGTAGAVKEAGKAGKVAVTGLSTPKSMKEYVKNGTVKTIVLWNPVDLGYLTMHAGKALIDGNLKPGVKSIKAGRLGECKIRGDEVLLGDPVQFTKDNIDKFDF